MNNPEFSPLESLEHAFKHWWVIVLITVLGGFAGWIFHFFQSPLYEATAVITANADFQKAKLTQTQQDYAFNAAGVIGNSTNVKNQIIAASKKLGFPIAVNQIEQVMFLERKQSVWEFHVRNRDPVIAAELANLWAEKAYEALNTALGHALLADQIQAQITNIIGSQSTAASPGLSAEAQVTLKGLSDELLQEKQLSKGVISIMKFATSESATVPQKIAIFNLADLVLAGACVGFIISLWVVGSFKAFRRG